MQIEFRRNYIFCMRICSPSKKMKTFEKKKNENKDFPRKKKARTYFPVYPQSITEIPFILIGNFCLTKQNDVILKMTAIIKNRFIRNIKKKLKRIKKI